jgi:undecaprenyl diphosphate synthase
MDPELPRHVAIIMDGNGRWARARGEARTKGHEAGAESVRAVVRACRERGVEVLTLYSFSTENWNRPPDEIAALMALLKRYVMQERSELMEKGIRVQVIGQLLRLPIFVRKPLQLLCKDSARNADMVLNLALSYGGRADIVDSMRHVARDVKSGLIDPDAITENLISDRLSTAGLPDPDLVIRTSGELRLSNFLLWQMAYSEFFVTDTLWPDFREPHLDEAFAAYAARKRRFGKTDAQVSGK